MWTQEEKSLLWLDSFPLEPAFKHNLLAAAGSAVRLVKRFGDFSGHFSDKAVFFRMQETLKDGSYFAALAARLEEEKIAPVFFGGEDYPVGWTTLTDAPVCLYAKGKLSLLKERKFAVVGSRRTTEGAKKLGTSIAKELCGPFAVVSGAADGGDEAALKGGLLGGKAICFLAGGFGSTPKENPLLPSVGKEGLVVAACPLDTPVRVYSYEYRNKLLAALCEGVLVLGAAKKSGALITAKYAKAFQKSVFAIPYAPSVAAGEGCNGLIKEGAYLTETAGDILTRYGCEKPQRVAPVLTELEQKIVDLLAEVEEMHISELSNRLGVATFKLTATLASLEVKGLAVKIGGNRYSAV
ncbi:MAG: DNA-protecting protein DprA [Clostridia bacterium]|nr:DNA-protecting protein DprA [Clostridia bacterium]